MKKITRLLLMTAIAIGMVACSNDDNLPDAPDANAAKGNTYASISIKLPKGPSPKGPSPKGPSTRALPKDYNDIGTWKGIDEIESVNVYLVNETYGTIDNATLVTGSYKGIDDEGVLYPNVALKATAGHNVKAYVVLNGNADVINSLNAATTLADFNAIYAKAVAKNASDLASNGGANDVIMMTNTVLPTAITIEANVDEATAIAGTKNSVKVEVERVVSRAIVTAEADAKTAEISVYAADGTTEGSKITIKSIEYGVGQSNKEFFMTKQTGYVTPTAVYEHVPSVDTWKPALFDYTGLEDSTEVKTATGTALANFSDALTGEGAASKFVLPVTHTDSNYRKGNTTFFEVIAIFTPDVVSTGTVVVEGVTKGSDDYVDGNDVFLGMNNGLFYNSRALAEASGQKATMYKGTGTADGGAIMKYVLWLNPDVIPGTPDKKATKSPTVRNQVYHAHITGFKQIGLPNNPLNPNEPDEFGDNPINPIKPEDPLQTEDTYLSVQITVLDWGIHSYGIELGNDY